jgi:hypothetical protein
MKDINDINSQLRGALTPRRIQTLLVVTLFFVAGTIALSIFSSWWFLCIGPVVYVAAVFFLLRDVMPAITSSMGMAGPGAARPNAGRSTTTAAAGGYDLSPLDDHYRASMNRALDTRRRIEQVVSETSDPGLRRALTDATSELPILTSTIYDLAIKACSIKTALGTTGDMARISAEIKRLNDSIKGTTDEFQKSQYHAALDGKLQQMQNYTDTTVALQRWDAQLDNALSTMDTILSQVVRIRSSEVLHRTGATDEVSRDLREQVESLKAASDAFDTLYGGQGSTNP